jgi:hypothetical protein
VDVTGWTHGYGALSPALNFAWEEISILEQLFPALPGFEDYRRTIQQITSESNLALIQIVEDLSFVFSDGRRNPWSADELRKRSRAFSSRLLETRDNFVLENQETLLESLSAGTARACA